MAAYGEYMQTQPTCGARAVDPSLPFETYELGLLPSNKNWPIAMNKVTIINTDPHCIKGLVRIAEVLESSLKGRCFFFLKKQM